MATIREHRTKSGQRRYYVQIRIKGHPHVRNHFSTIAEARKWARGVEDGLRSGRLVDKLEADKHTVSEAIQRYIDDHNDLDGEARRADRAAQLKVWDKLIGFHRLSQVTPAVVLDARRQLILERELTGATANRYMSALSKVFKIAAGQWAWMPDNPCTRIPRIREDKGRLRFLSEDERKALLKAAQDSDDERMYPVVLMALTTGARQGEIMDLEWKDVDLVAGTATLQKTKNSDRRTLHLSGDMIAKLHALPSRFTSRFVFANSDGIHRFPLKAWDKVRIAAGLEDFRFHDCRHTFASYAAMSGATLTELMAAMGHRSVQMVRRYAHLTEQHQKAMVERMWQNYNL